MNVTRRQVLQAGLAGGLWLGGISRLVAQVDPISAGASLVAVAALKEAVSYATGKLLGNVMGSPDAVRLEDVKVWIQTAVKELEEFVAQELQEKLDELAMNEMSADLDGVEHELYEYSLMDAHDRKSNAYLIQAANITTGRLVSFSLDYPQAIFVSSTAMGFSLISLNAQYEIDHVKAHIESAGPLMDKFVLGAKANRDLVAAGMAPAKRDYTYCYYVDGNSHFQCDAVINGHATSYKGMTDDTSVHNNEVKATNDVNLALPEVMKQWQQFIDSANTAINLACECYDKMCKSIGTRYPYTALPVSKTVVVPAGFAMAGARVGLPQ